MLPDLLGLGGRLAARAIHAYRAELARLDPPAARTEQNCVAASAQVNTASPARAWRTGEVSPVRALDGIGFTRDVPRDG